MLGVVLATEVVGAQNVIILVGDGTAILGTAHGDGRDMESHVGRKAKAAMCRSVAVPAHRPHLLRTLRPLRAASQDPSMS